MFELARVERLNLGLSAGAVAASLDLDVLEQIERCRAAQRLGPQSALGVDVAWSAPTGSLGAFEIRY